MYHTSADFMIFTIPNRFSVYDYQITIGNLKYMSFAGQSAECCVWFIGRMIFVSEMTCDVSIHSLSECATVSDPQYITNTFVHSYFSYVRFLVGDFD